MNDRVERSLAAFARLRETGDSRSKGGTEPKAIGGSGEGTVEDGLQALARTIAGVAGSKLFALLAVGSIGRAKASGTGGTDVEDYDLIVIADVKSNVTRLRLRRQIDEAVATVSADWVLPVSVGILLRRDLPHLRRTLFNYEMRHGYRVVVGTDPSSEMQTVEAADLPLIEVTRLLLNRGVLLWGDIIRSKKETATEVDLSQIGRRIRKVVLALGDALLLATKAYHWSYPERRQAALDCKEFDRFERWGLRQLYLRALESKVAGLNFDWGSSTVQEVLSELLDLHERILREIEQRRLQRTISDWSHYADLSMHYPRELSPSSGRRIFRTLRTFGIPRSIEFARAVWRSPAEELLLRSFPALAYGCPAGLGSLTARLNAPSHLVDDQARWQHFHQAWTRSSGA